MKKIYFGLVHAEDGGFWIEFPDFKSCYSQGDTVEELMLNAEDILEAYVASMADHNEEIPTPSNSTEIQKKAKSCEDDVIFCIPVGVYPPQKTVRINITAPGEKLSQITDYAKHNHLSRSELMTNASLSYIHSHR